MSRLTGKKCRIASMFSLTLTFFLVELIVGYVTNSMALVADSFHMLSDVASLVIAFLSVKMSPKKWSKNTFGWARAEVLGALVNAVFLVALCFSILVESLKRFYEVEEIHDAKLMLIVGSLGLLINLIGLVLFHDHGHGHSHGGGIHKESHGHSHGRGSHKESHGHSHGGSGHKESHGHSHGHSHLSQLVSMDDNDNDAAYHPHSHANRNEKKVKTKSAHNLNMRGVFLHVLADALGSVVVIISALLIWLTEWEYKMYIDPALSIAMVCIILWSTWPLLHESALILLQTVPTHIQLEDIQRKLLSQVDGVLAVHEFHVWQLAGDRIIASAHIRCRNLSDYMKIAEKVKEFFHNEGIHSTTIQPEFVELPENMETIEKESCALDCPVKDRACAASTCCGPSKQDSESIPDPEVLMNGCRQRPSAVAAAAAAANSFSPVDVNMDCACGSGGDPSLACIEQGIHAVRAPLLNQTTPL